MSSLAKTLNQIVHFPAFVWEVLASNNWTIAVNGAKEIFRSHGIRGVAVRLMELLEDRQKYLFPRYSDWIVHHEPPLVGMEQPALPTLISVLIPTYNTDPVHLRAAIESVRRQSFPSWELCIADDCSTNPEVRQLLTDYAQRDERIRLCLREENGHISAASNSALELARGDFIALLDHDDELPKDALLAVAQEISSHPDAVIIYSDEDKITPQGRRFGPVFKPDWDPDLMLQRNFVSHLGVYRTSTVRAVGGFRQGFEGSQDWDLTLRVSTACLPQQIRHIPRILYHWRAIPGSTALHINEKSYAVEAGLKAVTDHIARNSLPLACIRESNDAVFWTIRTLTAAPAPRVSIILGPSCDKDLLQSAADRLVQNTHYSDFEVLSAHSSTSCSDGDALEKAINDSSGTILCFMAPELIPPNPDWLEPMVVHAERADIGAVGACTLTPSSHIAHCGYVLDPEHVIASIYAGTPGFHRGYMDQATLLHTVSAHGGGCLVIQRNKFFGVGGYALGDYGKHLGDVDLCLRLAERGLRNVVLPRPMFRQLIAIDTTDSDLQLEKMRRTWLHRLGCDRAFNPNFQINQSCIELRRTTGSSVKPEATRD